MDSGIRDIYFSIFITLGLVKTKIIRILKLSIKLSWSKINWDIDLTVESQTLVKGFGSASFESALSHTQTNNL